MLHFHPILIFLNVSRVSAVQQIHLPLKNLTSKYFLKIPAHLNECKLHVNEVMLTGAK